MKAQERRNLASQRQYVAGTIQRYTAEQKVQLLLSTIGKKELAEHLTEALLKEGLR